MKLSWSFLKLITLLCTQLMVHVGGEHVQPQRRSTKDGLEKIENLKATGTSDTNVTIHWKLPNQKIRHFEVIVKVNEFLGCSDRNEPSPASQPIVRNATAKAEELSFEGLHPYTNYTTTVIAYINDHEEFKGELNFTTLQRDIPTEKIQNVRYDASKDVLTWDAPNCADMAGPWAKTNISFAENGRYVSGKSVSSDKLQINLQHVDKLRAYTTYKVHAYIVRSTETPDESAAHSEEINAKRPAAPPGKVNRMEAFNIDVEKRTISFLWDLPDPLNGEIESYHLEINHDEDEMPLLDETYKTPEQVSKCKLWEEFVCLENVRLETNFSGQLRAKISAKNKDVEEHGPEANDIVLGSDWRNAYFKPLHLKETIEDDGLVTVRWRHPPRPLLKIARFKIKAKLLESTLLNTNDHIQNTRKAIYSVEQEQKEYNQLFYLTTSSRYNISVIAESKQKTHIGIVDSYDIRVPFQAGFARGEKATAKCTGSDIEVVIPALVNATRNTTVDVFVLQQSEKTRKQNEKTPSVSKNVIYTTNYGSSLVNMTRHFKVNNTVARNCSKHPEHGYTVIVQLKDVLSGENITLPTYSPGTAESNSLKKRELLFIILVSLALTVILLTTTLLCYRKFRRSPRRENYNDIEYSPTPSRTDDLVYLHGDDLPPLTPTKMTDRISKHIYAVPYDKKAGNVSMTCFEEYTRKSVANGTLNAQYALFPKGLKRPCEYGRLPENMPKNRYKNLIPYDDTRVVLKKIPGDPHSDYINASYIPGYRNARRYIATQGPKANTVNDFWRMIWQEKVSVICMLTNVVEGGKTKCELYWPEIGTEKNYGDIKVTNKHHKVFADYTFRYFVLSCEKKTRQVTHLHYTGWPDRGVPTYTGSLVAYLKKLMESETDNSPVVVHCSAGDGRTGMIILCDICLNQIISDMTIDVPGVIDEMRNSRANMVGSKQQYLLAHIVITESIVYLPTQLPCADVLTNKMKQLRERLPYDFRRLNDTQWQIEALQSLAAPVILGVQNSGLSKESLTTVRLNAVQYQRYSTIDCESDETDTFGVDGVKMKNQFLASRIPSVTTLPEYWRYIAEKKIELIIILQAPNPGDPTHCDILPGDSILVPLPYIQVVTKSKLEEKHYTTEKLLLTDTSEEEARQQPVTVLTCTGWGCDKSGKPPEVAGLISLWKASEKIQRKAGPTSVLCRDGVTGCGLYLALSFLLERMTVERVCDVISAVRVVRRSRPEFVESTEQIEYLYDAAVNYAQSFQNYANFS